MKRQITLNQELDDNHEEASQQSNKHEMVTGENKYSAERKRDGIMGLELRVSEPIVSGETPGFVKKVKAKELVLPEEETTDQGRAFAGPLIDVLSPLGGKMRPVSSKRASINVLQHPRLRSGRPISVRSRSSYRSGITQSRDNMQNILLGRNVDKFTTEEH